MLREAGMPRRMCVGRMNCHKEGQGTKLGCGGREVQGALHGSWEHLRAQDGDRWGGTAFALGWGDAGYSAMQKGDMQGLV